MKFASTRGNSPALSTSAAIQTSLAPDGGLYVPEVFPVFHPQEFDRLDSWREISTKVLDPFFGADHLAPLLGEICEDAFSFPIVLKDLAEKTASLELFHGPTAAFKDIGARFLASCISRLPGHRTVLVATSGDTGGAVAAAFHGNTDVDVIILFPKGRVSPRQQAQLTCWGGNVRAFAVRGDFDDCQRIVKAAFSDTKFRTERRLLSANSINLGRLLPQTVYYAAASLWYLRRHGVAPGFIIPTGNLGNAVACFWAQKMGFPIREIVLAANANHSVPDYFSSGDWKPHPTITTLANAMDVGNPSNMERLRNLYPNLTQLRSHAQAFSVTDDEISRTIANGLERWGEPWCPHTAAAVFVREQLESPHWIVVATAHPAKFESIVEPLLGRTLDIPAPLAELLEKPSYLKEISADLDELIEATR
jgi:threonine synthase